MRRAKSTDALNTSIQGQLMLDEIQLIVAEAIAAGDILQTRPHAERLSTVYEGARLSKAEITNELIIAGASAKIAVEIQSAD